MTLQIIDEANGEQRCVTTTLGSPCEGEIETDECWEAAALDWDELEGQRVFHWLIPRG